MSKVTESMTDSPFFYTIEPFLVAYVQSLNQPLHRHAEAMELLLVLEGTVRCQIDGRIYTAPSGTVLFIPSGTWHELWNAAGEQQSGYRLSFKQDPLLEPALLAEWPPIIPISDFRGVKALFVRLQQEKEKTQPGAGQLAYHLIGLIMAMLSHRPETPPATSVNNEAKAIQEIKLYMEENHWRSLTLENIAERFNVDKYQLARTFKQQTGISPLQYLISCRIDSAKQLLVTTNHPAAAVAHAIGYKSVTQFQSAFKKAVGTTPRHYRLAHQPADLPSE